MKLTHTLNLMGSLLFTSLLLSSTANAVLTTTDLAENFEANSAGNTTLVWDNTVGTTNLTKTGTTQTLVAVSSSTTNIDKTYRFDGLGGFTSGGVNTFSAPISDNIVSFEFWIRPLSLGASSVLLFESGGGSGLTFFIDGSQNITLGSSGTTANLAYDLKTNSAWNGTNGLDDFIQIVATFNGSDATLYIDGNSVDTTTQSGGFNGTGNDDALAFGTTDHGGINPDAANNYQGDIAIMRIYNRVGGGF